MRPTAFDMVRRSENRRERAEAARDAILCHDALRDDAPESRRARTCHRRQDPMFRDALIPRSPVATQRHVPPRSRAGRHAARTMLCH